jgi:hypothetical protein
MSSSARRRRMLYERAFAAGRAVGHNDHTLTVRVAGSFVVFRCPISVCAFSTKMEFGPDLTIIVQDESGLQPSALDLVYG